MNTSSNNAVLISHYRESIEHMTTQKSNAAHNRFRDNPFIYNFALLLKGIKDGTITRKNYSAAKTVELVCRNRELPVPLTSAMLTIYGRTNKTIVKDFLCPSEITTESKRKAVAKAVTIDDICEYIYLTYQKKRKYESDSTLEELVDFMNLTGSSMSDMFWTNDEYNRRSVCVYIPPSAIEALDTLNSETVFPAFSIPAYGISFYLKVTPKQMLSSTAQQSKSIFQLFCIDPVGALKPFLHDELKDIKNRHSISSIHDWYEAWIMEFTDERSSYFLKDKYLAIQDLQGVRQTRWYKEWEMYQRETSALHKKRLRETQYLLSDDEETAEAAPKRKPSLDERLR